MKIETEIVNETETTENKTEDIQMEAVETPENVEVPEPMEVPETTETVVTQNEDVRPSTVEIPVMDTEEKSPETEEEEPEAVEEPVEEKEEEPAMTMEEEPEMETEEEYTVSETNYEKYIGENLFGKIGILIFIIGIGFFVKYAIDQNWINETARTMLAMPSEPVCLYWQNDCISVITPSVRCWQAVPSVSTISLRQSLPLL